MVLDCRGGQGNGRGHPQGERDGCQVRLGGSHYGGNVGIGRAYSTSVVSQVNNIPYLYAFLRKFEEQLLDTVIIGTILVYDQMDIILFDVGSTFSYGFIKFTLDQDKVFDMLDSPVYVSTLLEIL